MHFLKSACTKLIFGTETPAVRRSENSGVQVLFDWHTLSSLVKIGLTDLPKYGGQRYHGTPGTPRNNRPAYTGLKSKLKETNEQVSKPFLIASLPRGSIQIFISMVSKHIKQLTKTMIFSKI